MPVPEEIKNIKRPKNTVIIPYGKNKDKYAVRIRVGCKRKNGKNIPVDGPVIGHIINGKYVEKDNKPKIRQSSTDFRRWADVVFCDNRCNDILEDLKEVYNDEDAQKIYLIAMMRALESDINDYELKESYEDTFLSLMYPGVSLSRNVVSEFISDLGRTCSLIAKFMEIRTGHVPMEHVIAVDGTLKSDESKVNTFSDFSRKALKKGTKDLSVLYAFDVDLGEPICSKAYPGNAVDITLLEDFVRTQKITRGIIVADKGFSYNAAKEVFLENPDLHFIMPLKRNAKCIEEYRMYDYNSVLDNNEGMSFRKEKMKDGKFLYSFQDCVMESKEEKSWKNSHPEYDPAEFASVRREFGSIVFISDMDIDPSKAYSIYELRWEIELIFRFYKDILMLDQTKVHSDWSVIGTEFINFISVIMECRMKRTFSNVECLKKIPYAHVLKKLRRAVKIKNSNGEWELRKITEGEGEILIELGIIERPQVVKGKRGRPSKNES